MLNTLSYKVRRDYEDSKRWSRLFNELFLKETRYIEMPYIPINFNAEYRSTGLETCY